MRPIKCDEGMRPYTLTAFLRRLYLAASDLRPGVLLAAAVAHMALSYLLLQWAGEEKLRPLADFAYWYAVTASTVGYGDVSPQGAAGRIATIAFVLPGAIALFTTAIARAFAGLAAVWKRRRIGMGDFAEIQGATLLIGYDPSRTPRMIDELTADGAHDIIVVATQAMEVDDPRYRYVHASALTSASDLARAGIAGAARVIVKAGSDAETLAATLAVTAANRSAHVVAYLTDPDAAALIGAHCPRVEVVRAQSVELVVKALADPGASRVLAQLASHTDDGGTLYATPARSGESIGAAAQRLRGAGAILLAHAASRDAAIELPLDDAAPALGTLFYVARARVSA